MIFYTAQDIMHFKIFSTSVAVDEIDLCIVIFPSDGQLSNLSLGWAHEKQNRNNQSRYREKSLNMGEKSLSNMGEKSMSNMRRNSQNTCCIPNANHRCLEA